MERLVKEPGPSGFEDRVINVVKSLIDGFVDDVKVDRLGNLVARIGNGGFKILISAHVDEVGLMVTHIDQRGFARVTPIGGVSPQSIVGSPIVFLTERGELMGVVGVDPPHLRNIRQIGGFEDLYIDLGFSTREEAIKAGLSVGTPGVFQPLFLTNGQSIIGKALDNRVGCAVLVELARSIRREFPDLLKNYTLYLAWNTQEEVGLRGINAVVNETNPHLAIVVETTLALDTPANSEDRWITSIGGGVAVRAMDRSMITNPRVLSRVLKILDSGNVKYQVQVNPYGGTDAGVIHTYGLGVYTVVLSTPARYIHTPHSVASLRDVEEVEKALRAILSNLDAFKGMVD